MQDNIKYYYTSVSNVKLCNVDIKLSAHDAFLQWPSPWIDYLFLNIQRQIPRV
jgi:hypothetical protein